MVPDVRFEAEFLRAALLLGLIPEADVVAWADALIATDVDTSPLVLDLSLTRPELSALRDALWHLSEPNDLAATGAAVVTFMAADDVVARFTPAAFVGMLALMRTDKLLTTAQAEHAQLLGTRLMFVNGGVAGHSMPARDELRAWLGSVREPAAYFRVTTSGRDESAALIGALSRRPEVAGRAWAVSPTTLVLDEPLWQVLRGAFSPIPTASRIPYPSVPIDAALVFDAANGPAMGLEEASGLMAGVR